MSNHTCDMCGESFESDISTEEAEKECVALHGSLPPPEDRAIVCDPCFEQLKPGMPS